MIGKLAEMWVFVRKNREKQPPRVGHIATKPRNLIFWEGENEIPHLRDKKKPIIRGAGKKMEKAPREQLFAMFILKLANSQRVPAHPRGQRGISAPLPANLPSARGWVAGETWAPGNNGGFFAWAPLLALAAHRAARLAANG